MACKDYVRSAASAVLATNRVLLAPGNHDSGRLRLQVPPCRCIDFHPECRPRTQNGPATIERAPTSRKTLSQQFSWSLEQHVSPKPHLRNRERTFHVSPLPRINTSRRLERRCPLLGSSVARPRRDAPPQVLARVARPRTRARRRLAPRDATDRWRRTRLVAAAPAIVVSQQRPTAAPRRGGEGLNASPAFTATTGRSRGCFSTAYRVTRATRPAALSSASACSSACCS